MRSSSVKSIVAASGLLVLLAGCYPRDFVSVTGDYEGSLIERDGARTTQTQIAGELKSGGNWILDLALTTDETPARKWSLHLDATSFSRAWVKESGGAAVHLRQAEQSCYIDSDASSMEGATTRICYQNNQIRVDLGTLSFVLNRVDTGNMPKLERQADYTLSELARRSIERSFSSQIEFQNVVQAQLNSRKAHLDLLPHFGLTDIMGFAKISLAWTSLTGLIGKLAPFLIPSNWFKAKEARFNSQAEAWGYKLMQADSGNISAGLAYAIARDELSIDEMYREREIIAEARLEVAGRESAGLLPPGSTASVDTALEACDKTILGLRGAIADERRSLALSSGFFNPEAIGKLTVDTSFTIEHPEAFDVKKVDPIALNRSAELRQMDFLISAAQTDRRSRYFDWLDPSGGGSGIGFGMGAYIAIGAAEVQQAILKRQQVQAQVLQSVAGAEDDIEDAVSAYAIAQQSVATHDTLVNNVLKNISVGVAVSASEQITAFGGQMQANLDLLNAKFEYLVARENMQRLLFEGPYVKLSAQAN
jgi:hypothetical protein